MTCDRIQPITHHVQGDGTASSILVFQEGKNPFLFETEFKSPTSQKIPSTNKNSSRFKGHSDYLAFGVCVYISVGLGPMYRVLINTFKYQEYQNFSFEKL